MSAPRKLKGWGDARRSPGRRFSFQDDFGALITEGRRWIDHCYRLIHQGGRTVFVTEPYELGPEALDDLAALAGEGWDVTIRADRTEHYPGHTIWIGIQRERSTITPLSEVKAVPPPMCPLCCEQMHYMGGTLKGEDEAAGRTAPGWRCPDCGELAATLVDLNLHVKQRGRWTEIDADYHPRLHGDAARAAGELVLEGVEASIAAGRRTVFPIALGGCVAEIPSNKMGRELMLRRLRKEVARSGSVFITTCPKAETDRLVAGFRQIAGLTA